jgi:hypothetical protein
LYVRMGENMGRNVEHGTKTQPSTEITTRDKSAL